MSANLLITQPQPLLAPQLDFILVDGSGSMLSKWHETVLGLDTYLNQLRDANLNTHILTAVFSDNSGLLMQRDSTLSQCAKFSEQPLESTWGGTPLFDAINSMGRHLATLDPPRATILICTDGDENASTYTTLDQAKAILNWCRAKSWQVIFMGCDFNNSLQARALGANPDTAIGVQKQLLSDAARNLAEKRKAYGVDGSPIHFSESEQQQFGGLLAPPRA